MIRFEDDPAGGLPLLAIGVAAAGIGFCLAVCRFALEAFSRAKLLQGLTPGEDLERTEKLLESIERTTVAALVLALLCDVVVAAVAILAFGRLLGDPAIERPLTLACGALAAVLYLVVVCRLLPRALVARDSEGLVKRSLRVLTTLGALLTPIVAPLVWFRHGLRGLVGQDTPAEKGDAFTEEIIATVAEGEREGVVAQDEAAMIENVVEFRDVLVREVMTPRTDICWIDGKESVLAALRLAAEKGHSRLPVCDEDSDHVIGVFYVRDVIDQLDEFEALKQRPVAESCRKAHFVPDTKDLRSLLNEFRANKIQIGIVLDEYGGTAGLVTLEDVLERIVGQLDDEHDPAGATPLLTVHGPDRAEVDGRARIDAVNQALSIELPESADFDTVGGFVFSTLGRVPRPGESIHHDGVDVKVLAADERRVKRLEIRVVARARP